MTGPGRISQVNATRLGCRVALVLLLYVQSSAGQAFRVTGGEPLQAIELDHRGIGFVLFFILRLSLFLRAELRLFLQFSFALVFTSSVTHCGFSFKKQNCGLMFSDA